MSILKVWQVNMLFCRKLKYCRIYAFFVLIFGAKKCTRANFYAFCMSVIIIVVLFITFKSWLPSPSSRKSHAVMRREFLPGKRTDPSDDRGDTCRTPDQDYLETNYDEGSSWPDSQWWCQGRVLPPWQGSHPSLASSSWRRRNDLQGIESSSYFVHSFSSRWRNDLQVIESSCCFHPWSSPWQDCFQGI